MDSVIRKLHFSLTSNYQDDALPEAFFVKQFSRKGSRKCSRKGEMQYTMQLEAVKIIMLQVFSIRGFKLIIIIITDYNVTLSRQYH